MKKRICKKCNHSSLASTMVCPNCNASLASVKPIDVAEPSAKERAENLKPASGPAGHSRCPNCGEPLTNSSPYCAKCGTHLVQQHATYTSASSESNTGTYVLSVLVPIAGIIIGAIKIGNGEDTGTGRMCIILSVGSTLVCTLLAMAMYSVALG